MQPEDEVAGRYRLEELLSYGPMSEVWRADDRTLGRTVALKLLSPTADLERFRREARAVAALSHENIMKVYDYGEDEARPFMALEWLPGGTLEQCLAQGALPLEQTLRVAEGTAAGLAHLHARGLVHRDLKPANVLFDDEDRPRLGDFGLARHAAGAGTLTDAGTVLGTAAYISPEQAAGEPAGTVSDVYSFGVILFQMLTGALPFVADDALALIDMHRHSPPPAVEALRPDAPPALGALTTAALQKDPAERPADGEALLAALTVTPPTTDLAADTQITQTLPGLPEASARSRRRIITAAAAFALLALAGAALAWTVTRPPSTPAGISTAGAAGTKTGAAGSTQGALSATTRDSRHIGHHKRKRQATTTAAATTAPTTTAPPTTAPTTTTSPTTTQSTTTQSTTTSTSTTSTTSSTAS